MKHRWWRPLLIALRFVVSGGLLVYLVWQANPASIWRTWQAANLGLLLVALLIQLGCVALSAYKWGLLLRANRQGQPYRWVLAVYLLGQFANNFLPTSVGGDAMRVLALGRRTGSYARASASVFVERLSGFLALSLIALVALLVTSTDLFGMRLVTEPTLTLVAAGFAGAALVAGGLSLAAPWLLRRFDRWLPNLVRKPLQSVADALAEYASDRATLAKVLALSLLFHLCWIGLHWLCGVALVVKAPLLIYFLMVPLTDIVGLAPIFFNNLGARDLVFTLYLSQLAVPNETALALAFTAFSIRLLVSALGGLVLLLGGADVGQPRLEPEPTPSEAASRQP